MPLREFQDKIGAAQVPALIMQPEPCRGAVLLYHGLGAEKNVQRKEMGWLAEAGFTAVCIDAPHHGERDDGLLEKIAPLSNAQAYPYFINIVREAIREVPDLVDYCVNSHSNNVGITGISLGGFIAFGSVIAERRLKAAAPILGSPDWTPGNGEPSAEFRQLMNQAPVHFPDQFPPCALFAANAGKDVHVPPEATRAFFHTLRGVYSHSPERLKYIEYTESEHVMREGDWLDLWRQTIDWFTRYLIE